MGARLTVERDLRDFFAHGEIVSRLAVLVAKALGCDDAFCDELAVAGMLHDIGKLELADVIYGHRDDILAVERSKYVRMHPTLGIDVLRKEGAYSEEVISFIANHHENYDGTGYPHHLEGEEIPYGARILRVCDVFSALVSNRAYRAAFSVDVAVEEMIGDVREYDMKVFLAFLKVVYGPEFAPVREMIDRALLFDSEDLSTHAGDRGED
ncbi:MAG: HD domain-containing protein [Lachnospiraceae bacterium]|nr:HD domain-containing protein [Lachnospiraceae bacterium]MBQ2557621.1 HD domain-containing protein [Lachnospiraceae bacterium]